MTEQQQQTTERIEQTIEEISRSIARIEEKVTRLEAKAARANSEPRSGLNTTRELQEPRRHSCALLRFTASLDAGKFMRADGLASRNRRT